MLSFPTIIKYIRDMEKLEKFIYSVKYLAQILYFGSVGLIGYDIYYYVINDTEFISNSFVSGLIIFVFFYMTYLGVKKYQKK